MFMQCFFSLPAIIYLVMTPMWTRAQRFANAYAFVAIDALYTLLWFAAFIAVAMWNSSGIKEGAKDKNIPDGGPTNCTTFKWGSESKCTTSKSSVGVGVVVFILFGLTTAVSGYYLAKFMKEGVLPYESKSANPHHMTGDNSKDNAWSTEIETGHRDSNDDGRPTEHARVGNQQEDEYALLQNDADEGRAHPGRPLSWGDERSGYAAKPYAEYRDDTPGANALSPGGYDDYRRPADAVGGLPPPAGAGYSFGR